jgi:hypothetical protein
MRPAPAPALSPTRLARLHRLVFLTLVWFVGALWRWISGGGLDARRLRRDLNTLARGLGQLALLHAIASAPHPAPRPHHDKPKRRAGLLRAAVGARVRRVMRGRTWAARVFAIMSFMRALARHAARLGRRVRGGLTRRRAILPKRETAPCAAFEASSVAFDTS